MIWRSALTADITISVILHGLKIVVALYINWIVLNLFEISDFVTWSVTSSILVVATASDLGIGQYTVTRLINVDRSAWAEEVSDGLTTLIPLVLCSALFVLVAIDGPSTAYKASMALLLAGRVATIPFAATLNAANQFKIRKAIELFAYLLAAIAVSYIAWTQADVHWALLSLNVTFLIGAVLTVAVAARYVPLRRALSLSPPARVIGVARAAVPFMANNMTGLLTYGGFIWLASLVLGQGDVAKLAVLHSFVLVNLYQLYDVVLKARQADLIDPSRVARYRRTNWLVMVALPPLFVLAGRQALQLIGNPVPISTVETMLFGAFMAFELGNLFAQSIAQVSLGSMNRLTLYSVLRAGLLAAFAAAWMVGGRDGLTVLLAGLTLGSIVTFWYLTVATKSPSRTPESAGRLVH